MPKPQPNIRISQIKPVNNLVVSHKNKVVSPSTNLWPGRQNPKNASPVAFLLNSKKAARFEVTLEGDPGIFVGYTLQGADDEGNILFSGEVGDGPGVMVSEPAKNLVGKNAVNEQLNWSLSQQGKRTVKIGRNRMSIYWVPKTSKLHADRKGIPLESLEITAGAAPSVADLVNQVFSRNPPRYDTQHGRSYFTSFSSFDSITLHYQLYLAAIGHPSFVLNCYDAAAVLQYLLQQAGVNTQYCYLQPFGYLRETNLIGRGPCNNPFYASSGGPQVIGVNDRHRTAFGNHAFISLTDTQSIVDACAGPHTGNDSEQSYIDSAIDNQFPNPPAVPAGTVQDIAKYRGVVSHNFIYSVTNARALPHAASFEKMLGFSRAPAWAGSPAGIAGKWPGPLQCKSLQKNGHPGTRILRRAQKKC